MVMGLVKQGLVMQQKSLINSFNSDGYLYLKDFFDKDVVTSILHEAKQIFFNQFVRTKLTTKSFDKLSTNEFDYLLFDFFEKDIQSYIYCGKQVQHLISLHRLSLNEKIMNVLGQVGIVQPIISTRPVMYFNHKKLSRERVYHSVDAHQDWRSMQGSLNAAVLRVPLTEISKKLGALRVVPKSHKRGLVTSNVEHGFGFVNLSNEDQQNMIDVEMNLGDALLFSSFLIHQSGDNISDTPRWSCHFRYNDINEKTFIDRGYPHPYIYKPDSTLITKNFPSLKHIQSIFS